MQKVTALSLVAMLAAAGPCAAGFYSGNKLFEMCTAPDGTPIRAQCAGYIEGIADEMQVHGLPACIPAGKVDSRQVNDVVVSYLRDHAAIRHLDAAPLVEAALSQAFPCK